MAATTMAAIRMPVPSVSLWARFRREFRLCCGEVVLMAYSSVVIDIGDNNDFILMFAIVQKVAH
jgi:hypothetical protein